MNLIEVFHEYLTQVYWEEYPDYLLKHDPEKYQFEYEEFIRIYS